MMILMHIRSENGGSKGLERRLVDGDEVEMVEEERRERNGEHDRDEEEEEDVETRHFPFRTRGPELDEILEGKRRE